MIKSQQLIKHAPFEIESSELEKGIVRKVVEQLKAGRSLSSMGGVSGLGLNNVNFR